jgi:hypothetical protein
LKKDSHCSVLVMGLAFLAPLRGFFFITCPHTNQTPPLARLGDAKSSLGDVKSSLGDTESSLGDATSSLSDAKSLAG